jgi:hypothetical protein
MSNILSQNYYDCPEISNSALSTFNYDIGLYYKTYISKEITSKKSKAMDFGSFMHMLLLEPEKESEYTIIDNIVEPTGKMLPYIQCLAKYELATLHITELRDAFDQAFIASEYDTKRNSPAKLRETYLTNEEYQKYYDYLRLLNSDTKIIKREEFDKAKNLERIISNNNQLNDLFPLPTEIDQNKIYHELEIFWEYEGIKLKSKLDKLSVDHSKKIVRYLDFKTDGVNPIHKYKDSFEYWKTYRQMAFYKMAIQYWLKEQKLENYQIEIFIGVIDLKNDKFAVMEIGDAYLNKGKEEILIDIIALNWHINNNRWDFTMTQYFELDHYNTILLKPDEYKPHEEFIKTS